VALVRTDVSEEPGASFIRVTKIGELGTTQAATSKRRTLRACNVSKDIRYCCRRKRLDKRQRSSALYRELKQLRLYELTAHASFWSLLKRTEDCVSREKWANCLTWHVNWYLRVQAYVAKRTKMIDVWVPLKTRVAGGSRGLLVTRDCWYVQVLSWCKKFMHWWLQIIGIWADKWKM
jgi:hypothetical protein